MKRHNRLRMILTLAALGFVFGYNNCGGMLGIDSLTGRSVKGQDVITGNPFNTGKVAALPQIYLISDFPSLSDSHQILTVGNGKQFTSCQLAVDAAMPGDEVKIDAGYVCPPFSLRNKGLSSKYIVIESANLSSLPPQGTRITRNDEPNMAIVESDGTEPAISADPLAHHYYLVGLEMRVNQSSTLVTPSLVSIGSAAAIANGTISDLPHDIIIARSWLHGLDDQEITRGMDLNGSAISLVDSIIDQIHANGKYASQMGQAIGIWNSGYGPFKITNNELLSSGANIGIGEHSTKIPNLIPSDIQVAQNWIHKDLSWNNAVTSNTGTVGVWPQDSLVHMANAQRIIYDGNIFEDLEQPSQSSPVWLFAIVVSPDSGGLWAGSGAMPWVRVQDITVSNNIIRNTPGAFHISFQDYNLSTVIARRLDYENNLVYNQTNLPTQGSRGLIDLAGQGSGSAVFNHNTLLGGPGSDLSVVRLWKVNNPSVVFTNNISFSRFGFHDPAAPDSAAAIAAGLPNVNFSNNVLGGLTSSGFGSYAAGNFFPTNSSDIGFIADPAGGVSDYHSLSLSPGSPYFQKAPGPLDIGAIISFIDSALSQSPVP